MALLSTRYLYQLQYWNATLCDITINDDPHPTRCFIFFLRNVALVNQKQANVQKHLKTKCDEIKTKK